MPKGTLNKVMLIGNLGRDPEVKHLDSGITISQFQIATSDSYKNKETNNYEEKTEWHKIICFGKLAEISEQYLKKGSKIFIEGKIQTKQWQDKETGIKKYSTEILCSSIEMLGGNNAEIEIKNKKQKTEESFDDDIPF